jgi:hypothetical protein
MAAAVRRRTYCHSLAKKSGNDFPRPGIVGVDHRSIAMFIFRLKCRFCGCGRREAQLLQNETPCRDSATEQLQK